MATVAPYMTTPNIKNAGAKPQQQANQFSSNVVGGGTSTARPLAAPKLGQTTSQAVASTGWNQQMAQQQSLLQQQQAKFNQAQAQAAASGQAPRTMLGTAVGQSNAPTAAGQYQTQAAPQRQMTTQAPTRQPGTATGQLTKQQGINMGMVAGTQGAGQTLAAGGGTKAYTPPVPTAPNNSGLAYQTATLPSASQGKVGTINPTALPPGALSGYSQSFGGPPVAPPLSGYGTSTPPKTTAPTAPAQPSTGAPKPATVPGQSIDPGYSFTPMQPWTPVPFNQTTTGQALPKPAAPTASTTQGALGMGLGNGSQAEKFSNIFNPDAYKDNDAETPNYLSQIIPLMQLQQNAYQYGQDSNQAAYQYQQQFNAQQQQNSFQNQLAMQQQNAAQWQANQAASQWAQQFGQTQKTDDWSHQIAQGQLAQQGQYNNAQAQYWQGQNQNQAQQNANALTIAQGQNQSQQNVASTYANAQMYGSNNQLAGDKYTAQQQLAGQKYAADQSLAQAGLYSNAQMYGSNQQLAGDKYQADKQLSGQLGSANIYGNAQMYGANQQFAGTKYESDVNKAIAQQQNAFLYAQLQQQAQQAAAERANQLAMTNAQVYGRSGAAPNANWARSWA